MAKPSNLMHGKICLVTGATSGIGQVTARALAEQGATVIVVGRNREKSAATVSQIQQQTGNPAVEFLLADLSSQQAIRQLVQQFQSRYQRLHVLVNNAGAVFGQRQESVDGIEMTLAVNYLAPFLLTNLLLDTLLASAPARIINVSSGLHTGARIELDNLQGQRRYVGFQFGQSAYGQAKLALIMFTYELARRLAGTGVTVNALSPGMVATNLGRDAGGFMSLMKRLADLFALSPEEGAQTSIYLATSPEVEGVSGQYFDKKKAVPSSPASYDQAVASQLWRVSEAMTGLRPPPRIPEGIQIVH